MKTVPDKERSRGAAGGGVVAGGLVVVEGAVGVDPPHAVSSTIAPASTAYENKEQEDHVVKGFLQNSPDVLRLVRRALDRVGLTDSR